MSMLRTATRDIQASHPRRRRAPGTAKCAIWPFLVPVSEPVGWAALAEGCTVAVTAGCLAVCAANRAPGSDLGNQTNKSTRSPAASVPCHCHPHILPAQPAQATLLLRHHRPRVDAAGGAAAATGLHPRRRRPAR